MKKIKIGEFHLEQVLLPLIMVGVLVAAALSFFSYAYYAPTFSSGNSEMFLSLPSISAPVEKIYWAIDSGRLMIRNSVFPGIPINGSINSTDQFSSSSMPPWHAYNTSINNLAISSPISPTSTAYWFANLNIGNATTHNLNYISTKSITNTAYMFNNTTVQAKPNVGCVNFSEFNPTSLTNTAYMFNKLNCIPDEATGASRTIHLNNLTISSVSNATSMFGNMIQVQNIYTGYGFMAEQSGTTTNMFYNSTTLCGAHGTCYNTIVNLTNASYAGNGRFAMLDNTIYTTTPGYFSEDGTRLQEYKFIFDFTYNNGSNTNPGMPTSQTFTAYGNSGGIKDIMGFQANFANSSNKIWPKDIVPDGYTHVLDCLNSEALDCSEGTVIGLNGSSSTTVALGSNTSQKIYVHFEINPIASSKCRRINGTSLSWEKGTKFICNLDKYRYFYLLNYSGGAVYLLLDRNYTDNGVPERMAWSSSTSSTTPNTLNTYISTIASSWGATNGVALPTFDQIVMASSYAGNSAYSLDMSSTSKTLITSGYTLGNDPKNWLYDYMNNTALPHSISENIQGYWLANESGYSSTQAFSVYKNGTIYRRSKTTTTYYGIRPVLFRAQASIENP